MVIGFFIVILKCILKVGLFVLKVGLSLIGLILDVFCLMLRLVLILASSGTW